MKGCSFPRPGPAGCRPPPKAAASVGAARPTELSLSGRQEQHLPGLLGLRDGHCHLALHQQFKCPYSPPTSS